MSSDLSPPIQVSITCAPPELPIIARPLQALLSRRCLPTIIQPSPSSSTLTPSPPPVAVFILSPSFLASPQCLGYLSRLFTLIDSPKSSHFQPPFLIPVFYTMSVSDCMAVGFRRGKQANYQSLPGPNTRARDALPRLAKYVGIVNDEGATNHSNQPMAALRTALVSRVVEYVHAIGSRYFNHPAWVRELRLLPTHGRRRWDVFRPRHLVPPLLPHVSLDFEARNEQGGFATMEGKLKGHLMASLEGVDDLDSIVAGRVALRMPAAVGMGGTGKSVAMIGLAWESDVRAAFSDGIYFVTGGEAADGSDLMAELAHCVEACGGVEFAVSVRQAPDLKTAILRVATWFRKKKVLFLLDNLWEIDATSVGFFVELRQILFPAGRMVVTTRFKGIAYTAGCVVYFTPFQSSSDMSRNVLLRHVGVGVDDVGPEDMDGDSNLEAILDSCAGLPLALGIAGRAVREIITRDGVTLRIAIKSYCVSLRGKPDMQVFEGSGTYGGLFRMVKASLGAADRWMRREDYVGHSFSILPPSELFERLAAVRKQNRFSASFLSKLWSTRDATQANTVAAKLTKLCLLSESRGLYKLHDLFIDICTLWASNKGQLHLYHDEFLRSFSSPTVDGSRREWWSTRSDCDDYLRENLVWHLVQSKRLDELRNLLLDARWAWYRIAGGNFHLWQNDFLEFQSGVLCTSRDNGDSSDGDSRGMRRGMKLVELVVSLGWSDLRKNPSELAFQVIGRLGRNSEDLAETREFLSSATRSAMRPWLKPTQQCLEGPESRLAMTIPMVGPIHALAMDKVANRAYVSVRNEIAAIDLGSRQVITKAQGERHVVQSLAISGDGQNVVSGSTDAKVRVWDGETLQEMGEPVEYGSSVTCVAISHNGKSIVSGSLRKGLSVWNVECMCEVSKDLEGNGDTVTCVALSKDGKRVVSGSSDALLRVWNTEHMKLVGEPLTGHSGVVGCVCMSADGKRVVSGSEDKTVRIWDIESMRQVGEPLTGHTGEVWCVDMSEDGMVIVSGSADQTIRVWDARRMCEIGEPLKGHRGSVTSVAVSLDGNVIVSGSLDETMRMWHVRHPFERSELLTHDSTAVAHAAGSSNGRRASTRLRSRMGYRFGEYSCVGVSKDGAKMAFGFLDGTVRVWTGEGMHEIHGPFHGHSGRVTCVDMSEDGRKIASGSWDGTVNVWDTRRVGGVGRPLEGHAGGVSCVAISRDGKRFVSGSWDKMVCVWDAERMCRVGEPLRGHSSWVSYVLLSENGKRIVSGSWDGTVWAWDAENMCPLGRTLIFNCNLLGLEFMGNDVVVCVTSKGSFLFRIDSAYGLEMVHPSRVRSRVYGVGGYRERSLIYCVGTAIMMEFPKRKLLGKLEEVVEAWAYVEETGVLVTYLRNGRLVKFELVS